MSQFRRYLLILASIAFFAYTYFLFPKSTYASGELFSPWAQTLNLPNNIASHSMINDSNTFYLFGGANTDDYSEILSPTLNNNSGNILSWNVNNSLPVTRYYSSVVSYSNDVYVLGGAEFNNGQSYVDTVFKSNMTSGFSSWLELNPLPEKRGLGGAVVVGDKLYYLGGRNSSGVPQKNIYVASINSDGTTGTWENAGFLPEPLAAFGLVENNNHIIVVGGINNLGTIRSRVYSLSLDEDGRINGWTENYATPDPLYRSSYVKVNNIVVAVGGSNFSGYLNKVYYAELNQDGSVGEWKISSYRLPQPVSAAAAAHVNGYIYLTGGFLNGSYLNTVYFTKLNNISELSVPHFKQTDPQWAEFEYDTAHLWSAPEPPTIHRWGCAMTSAAMIFNFHGIKKLPDGTNLDPGTLNSWLKNEKDGYVGNGYVNWLALSRLSKRAKSQNSAFAFDALEFRRVNGKDNTQLKEDIKNKQPDILGVPGHFVVAKGIKGEDFSIHDPYYDRYSLSDYSGNYLSLNRFIPSKTDLSYIMVVAQKDTDIIIKDNNGNSIGEEFLENPIIDPVNGQKKNGDPVKIVYVPQPLFDEYTLYITQSEKIYTTTIYLYDKDGNVKIQEVSGITSTSPDEIIIEFDKRNNEASRIVVSSSYDQFLQDLESLYNLNEIIQSQFLSLSAQTKAAKTISQKNKDAASKVMEVIVKELTKRTGEGVSQNAFEVLYPQAEYLKNNP